MNNSLRIIEIIILVVVFLLGSFSFSQLPIDSLGNLVKGVDVSIPETIITNIAPFTNINDVLGGGSGAIFIPEVNKKDWARAQSLAFAVDEYRQHLDLLDVSINFINSNNYKDHSDPALFLVTKSDENSLEILKERDLDFDTNVLGEQGFVITSCEGSIFIIGNTRIGVLYGVYKLLEEIGFLWPDPYEVLVPSRQELLTIKSLPIIEIPVVELRGFWIYGENTDEVIVPDNFAVWMARNRLNLSGGISPDLSVKLGIYRWAGKHDILQQELSKSGIFEMHPQWFAEVAGKRREISPSESTFFNPNFSNSEMANYIADRLIERLSNGDLKDVDIVNIWPTDTRSGYRWDESTDSINLGNKTDNLLSFYSIVASRIHNAFLEGKIDRNVILAGISYYQTWQPPTNEIVMNRLEEQQNYVHVFYMNQIDFSSELVSSIETKQGNEKLIATLDTWYKSVQLKYGVVEYFNYSIYSAVALAELQYLAKNTTFLTNKNKSLFAYMHPLKHSGPRRLTNYLLSKLLWQHLDLDDYNFKLPNENLLKEDYFKRMYGSYSYDWEKIYNTMTLSSSNILQMARYCTLALFSDYYWQDGALTLEEKIETIYACKMGGSQDLFDVPYRVKIQNSFIGLEESIELQIRANGWAKAIIKKTHIRPQIKNRMLEDIVWFDATLVRYKLLNDAMDYYLYLKNTANPNSNEIDKLRSKIVDEIEYLDNSIVTNDTYSTVNQRGSILGPYRYLLDQEY